jgi:hypothetical protein
MRVLEASGRALKRRKWRERKPRGRTTVETNGRQRRANKRDVRGQLLTRNFPGAHNLSSSLRRILYQSEVRERPAEAAPFCNHGRKDRGRVRRTAGERSGKVRGSNSHSKAGDEQGSRPQVPERFRAQALRPSWLAATNHPNDLTQLRQHPQRPPPPRIRERSPLRPWPRRRRPPNRRSH